MKSLKKNYAAFWNRVPAERCLFYLTVTEKAPDDKAPDTPEKKWGDIDRRVSCIKDDIKRTTYYADAFPSVFTNFGPGCLSACIGGDYVFAPDTVWFDRNPIISDWNNLPKIEFDPQSSMWQLTKSMTDKLCAESGDEYYTSVTDLGGTIDIIASLRGSQDLLYDLYDNPEPVKALTEKVCEIWKYTYTMLADTLFKNQNGMTSWMPIWCGERYYPLQCDFSAMISPDMFAEFILPDLKLQTEFLDRSIYHLDGPGEIPHLDHLLSLPRLDAIQWTPGDGSGDAMDECWFDMYKKIQAAGKGVVLFTSQPQKIESCLKSISTKGLFICTKAANHYDANELVSMVNAIGLK